MSENTQAEPKTLGWIDMIVSNPGETSRFYQEVLGMGREAVPEDEEHTSYALLDGEGKEVLGICDAAVFKDWVEGWLPYLNIENYEESVAKVEAAGGTVLKEMVFDYNWKGQRFCLVRDPSQAPVMLCEIQAPQSA